MVDLFGIYTSTKTSYDFDLFARLTRRQRWTDGGRGREQLVALDRLRSPQLTTIVHLSQLLRVRHEWGVVDSQRR